MSTTNGQPDSTDIHALSGAYAVDALTNEERAAFTEHLATCPACRAEVAELQDTAALLASTAAVPPPASLRSAVLDQIATVRPLPPVEDEVSARRERRSRGRLALIAVAAALVAIVGIGVGVGVLDRDGNDDPAPVASDDPTSESIEAVLAASDVQTAQPAPGAGLPDGATATVHWSDDLDQAVIVTSGMPAPAAGTVYELWFADESGAMLPAGLMTGEHDQLLLDGAVDGATAVGITIEPEGGSPEPTTAPIALFSLENA